MKDIETNYINGGRKPHEMIEVVFDVCYLLAVLICGGYFLLHRMDHPVLLLYGIMIWVLGGGDSFHLVPRIAVILSGDKKRWQRALGMGKMITSITMTVMYLLLYFVNVVLYPQAEIRAYDQMILLILLVMVALRIVFCLLPQNRWVQGGADIKWAAARNIPFLVIGLIVLVLYGMTGQQFPDGFRFMSTAVFFSFLFYIPVAFGSGKHPALGALMLPKTAMYLWIAAMGFSVCL